MTLFRKIFKRSHKFDTNKPVSCLQGGMRLKGYKCLHCGCVLFFSAEQLADLPESKRYCSC